MNTVGYTPPRPSDGQDEPEIFDALADLFIGPPSISKTPPPLGSNNPPAASPMTGPAPTGPKGPVATEPRSATRPPLRLTPSPSESDTASDDRARTIPRKTQRTTPVVPEAQGPAPAAEIEAIVLGALPGRASAWARQYAASRLTTEPKGRRVAFVRCGQGSLSVEHLGLRNDEHPGVEGMELGGVLDTLRRQNALVLVRTLDDTTASLAADARLGRVTLLCGADDASIVSAYRDLRQVLDARTAKGEHRSAAPALRVVVCGSDADAIANARARLAGAIARFAGGGAEIVAGPDRIRPLAATLVFDGGAFDGPDQSEAQSAERSLGAVLDRLRSPESADRPRGRTASENSEVRPAPAGRPADAVPAQSASVARERQQSLPAPAAAPAAAVRTTSTGRTGSIAIAGLTEIEARCPFAQGVSLRLDGSGGLHLVAQCGADPRDAIAQLAAARDWANEHLDLLRLTPGATTLGAVTAEHLITEHPRSVRRLLDGERRVHVVATVLVNGAAQRVCVAVN